ncbi:hypothetical protein JCM9279_000039 [Rhodotorula babjevae]
MLMPTTSSQAPAHAAMSGPTTPFTSTSPATPPTMSRASSSSGQSEPSSSAMTPSRSWQRSAPSSTFVNGRGNVQQAAAAAHYVPQGGGGSGGGGSAQGSPMLGAPVQRQGQQAYVRRDLSPAPSLPRRGSGGSAQQLDGAVGETAAVFLPNQFGVRQRVAIKTSSRPPAPRSSLTPQRRSSAMSTSLSAEGRAASNNGGQSPHARSPSPSYHPPSATSSRSASLHPPSPHGSTPMLGSTAPTSERSPSPSPSARSGYTSILDRPRPRTPDPNGSVYSLAPSRSPSPTVYRSSFASSNGGGSGTVTPTPSAPPSTQKTSVLDRPRPKTPDAAAVFRFGEGGTDTSSPTSRPRTPDARPNAPDASSVFAYSAPAAGDDDLVERAVKKEEERPAKRSVLDRPRPRTPDSQAWLDSAAPASSSRAPFAFGAGPSSAPPQGRFVAAQHHRPSGSGTTTSGFSSYKGGSFDSIGPTALSASTQASTTATSARPSLDSSPSASSAARDAPLLDFNFDFGSSFGSTETMFGLSDLLKLGPSVGLDKTASASASTAPATAYSPARTEIAASPVPTRPPTSSSAASVPHTRTASAASSGGTSGFLSLPGGASSTANGRVTPRKEPPKVDLQLELELEIERALPPHRPLVGEAPPRASFSSSVAGREDELGRRAPRAHASVSSIGSTAASGRSASVSGGSVFSMGLSGGAQGSSPRPKRRRRKSLASLLSFGSVSQSGHGGEGALGGGSAREGGDPEPASKVQLAPPILPPVAPTGPPIEFSTLSTAPDVLTSASSDPARPPAASFVPPADPASASLFPPFGELSLDKSLPPTPAAGASSAPSAPSSPRTAAEPSQPPPDSPTKRSFGVAVDAANKGLTRQLSKLRNRGASSSSASDVRARNPNFQLISATTTRRPSQQHDRKTSISSLRTADTHGSRRSSVDYGGYQANGAPASSARARTETSSSAPVASSVPFGRRLVDRFTKGAASRPTAPAAQPETWTMPVRDHSDEPAPPRRTGRRRGSFSSLLGVGSASADGHGAATSAPKKILGMSLPSGRGSDDLLTSGRGGGQERSGAGPSTSSAAPVAQRGLDLGARRSFDLLTDRAAVPRRPSTDDLITLATAKLSSLAISSQAADASTASPSAEPSTLESAQRSTASSGTSSPDDGDTGDKADTTIEIAAVVRLPEASSILQPAADASTLEPAPRVLARSDSLKARRPPAPAPAPAMPTRAPAPPVEPVVAPSAAPPRPAPAPRPRVPHVVPVWRLARAQPQDVQLETRMTRAWLELEDALQAFHSQTHDRVAIVKHVLLPFLWHEEDSPSPSARTSLAQRHRQTLFGWMDVLMAELESDHERHRGTFLESLAALAESHLLSHDALEGDPEAQQVYRTSLVGMLAFAVEKLNHKAVFSNILAFSGRIFALSFFRIAGVGLKLLRALPPVKQQGLRRILAEAGVEENDLPPVDDRAYPRHLSNLCLRDYRAYAALLVSPKPPTDVIDKLVDDCDVKIELTGNWLIRWTASDSDLSFNFYRAYHRQLAAHLLPTSLRSSVADLDYLPASVVVTAPGYLFLAASLLEKIDSLVHRSLRTSTSIGPTSSSFNTNDSANLSFGTKPKVLELAQRRVSSTLIEIVGGSPSAVTMEEGPLDVVARRYVFGGMLQVWLRACVKRTSLWDVRGVYLVSDLIESLMYKLAYSTRPEGDDEGPPMPDERGLRLFDLPFLFGTIRLILEQADNTVTIMRTIALVYANFDAFTALPAHRTELCEKVILDENLFRRLLLHYNSSVRNYWIRLLVWRLSRLGRAAQEQHPGRRPDSDILALFSLLNVRLEAVRKRHDQLEPRSNFADDSTLYRPKRSTICSTHGVKGAPWAVDAIGGAVEEESDEDDDENAQELVRSAPPSKGASSGGRKQDLKTVAKVVSWLKGGLGKKQGRGARTTIGDAPVDPFLLEQSDSARSSTSTDRPPQGPTPLPTTIETGLVPTPTSRGPHTPDAPTQGVRSSPSPSLAGRRPRPKSGRAERRRSLNPAFFAFEFENGVVARNDVDPTVVSSAASSASASTTASGDTTFPSAPIRARPPGGPSAALSPRVSLRFSKRISILPPAALDLLKEAHGSEPVPPIPARYRDSVESGYARHLHTYAVLGLRDYEDALIEWTEWMAQLAEEEGETRTVLDVVPRLGVSWPLSGEE